MKMKSDITLNCILFELIGLVADLNAMHNVNRHDFMIISISCCEIILLGSH